MLVPTHVTSLAIMLLLSAAAATYDLRTSLIPNRLILAGLALTLLERTVVEPWLEGESVVAALITAAVGAVAASVIPLALYASKGLGGGDLKLLVTLGAAGGPLAGLEVQVYAFAVGALFAFGYLAYRGMLLRTLARSTTLLVPSFALRTRPEDETRPERVLQFRFGPAIFAGALITAAHHLVRR
jgi:Flp pilus assembly protein protease CpaA